MLAPRRHRRTLLATALAAAAVGASLLAAPPGTATGSSTAAVARTPALAAAPAAARVDPGTPGPYAVETSDYELAPVRLVDHGLPVEMVGSVVAPVGAPGPRPLVLFLHGKHVTCDDPGSDQTSTTWPCPDGWTPVPSHLGYTYLQRLLASQGYVTVSVSANGISGQPVTTPDQGAAARAQLVARHLRRWATWSTAVGSPWNGRVDLDRVTLVGHSRGGEGVHQAAVVTPPSAPYRIDGVVLIAPTDVGLQALPGTPSVTLFGYCDGDVPTLEGQRYADAARLLDDGGGPLRSSVLVMGANHNWFNTEWTPATSVAGAQDDWYLDDDPVCGRDAPTRLSPLRQRQVAKAYVAGAVRLFAEEDDTLLPMFDGSRAVVPSAGTADVRSTAVGADRELVLARDLTAAATGAVQVSPCRGWSQGPAGACGAGVDNARTPHWPIGDQYPYPPGQVALEVAWSDASGRVRLGLPAPLDLSDRTSLDARVAVGPAVDAVRFRVRLTDAAGGSALLTPRSRGRLDALPGGRPLLGKLWAQTLRTPLTGTDGVDLTSVVAVDLVPRTARGRVWLLDLAGRRPGLPEAPALPVPVVDVVDLDTPEGSAADPQHLDVPLRVRGDLPRPARVLVRVADPDLGDALLRTSVLLRPGKPASVPVPFQRDDVDDGPFPRYLTVIVLSVDGAVAVGDYAAVLTVRDDDPPPAVRVRRLDRRVGEGGALRWRVGIAEPVEYAADIGWRVVRGDATTPALATDDVPASWLRDLGVEPPADPLPLWQVPGLGGSVGLGFETVRGRVTVPTRADARAEGVEALTLRLTSDTLLPRPLTSTILVRP